MNFRALVWFERGEFEKAIADCDAAIQLDPQSPLAFSNRSLVLNKMGQFDRRLNRLQRGASPSIRNWQTPSKTAAWPGTASAIAKKPWRTLPRRSASSRPWQPLSRAAHGCVQCVSIDAFGNGQQAVQDATKACELTRWNKPDSLAALAAAYAAAGDFDAATEWEAKAEALRSE